MATAFDYRMIGQYHELLKLFIKIGCNILHAGCPGSTLLEKVSAPLDYRITIRCKHININDMSYIIVFKTKGSRDICGEISQKCGMQQASAHQVAESTLRLVGSEGLEEGEDLRQRQHRMLLWADVGRWLSK